MIDIVVPVYNEGENIKILLEKINSEINMPKRLILIYDNPSDTTIPTVNDDRDKYDYEIILEQNHYGSGALNAIKSGLESSVSKAVLVTMADLSDSLTSVELMYEKVCQGYDLVCGSRYMKGGNQQGGPILKSLFSKLAGISLHYLIKIPTYDVTNSFKMYTKNILQEFRIESNGGFELGMELAIKSYVEGFRVSEVPANWIDRVDGESNFKLWRWIPKYLYWYFYGIRYTWFGGKKRRKKRKNAHNIFREEIKIGS